jgi:hypothetical protein
MQRTQCYLWYCVVWFITLLVKPFSEFILANKSIIEQNMLEFFDDSVHLI